MPMNRMDETLGHCRQVIEIRQKIRFSKIDAPDSQSFFLSFAFSYVTDLIISLLKKENEKEKTSFFFSYEQLLSL